MRKYNYRRAAAKEKAKEAEYALHTCQICGKQSVNCIWGDDVSGRTSYCVCPTCFMWSDELPAQLARTAVRGKQTPAASTKKAKRKLGKK